MKRLLPTIASYHSGPYSLAAVLRDPGRVGRGCGAVTTREIGVLNYQRHPTDQTARNCHAALLHAGLPLSAYLPMNAVPWFDGKADAASLREGAAMNAEAIIEHRIKRVLLMGKEAQRSRRYLEPILPEFVCLFDLPHPGVLGLSAMKRRDQLVSYDAAKKVFLERFAKASRGQCS